MISKAAYPAAWGDTMQEMTLMPGTGRHRGGKSIRIYPGENGRVQVHGRIWGRKGGRGESQYMYGASSKIGNLPLLIAFIFDGHKGAETEIVGRDWM